MKSQTPNPEIEKIPEDEENDVWDIPAFLRQRN